VRADQRHGYVSVHEVTLYWIFECVLEEDDDDSKNSIDNTYDDNEDIPADGDDTDEDDTEEGIDLGYHCILAYRCDQEGIHDLQVHDLLDQVHDLVLQVTLQRTNVDIDSSAPWF